MPKDQNRNPLLLGVLMALSALCPGVSHAQGDPPLLSDTSLRVFRVLMLNQMIRERLATELDLSQIRAAYGVDQTQWRISAHSLQFSLGAAGTASAVLAASFAAEASTVRGWPILGRLIVSTTSAGSAHFAFAASSSISDRLRTRNLLSSDVATIRHMGYAKVIDQEVTEVTEAAATVFGFDSAAHAALKEAVSEEWVRLLLESETSGLPPRPIDAVKIMANTLSPRDGQPLIDPQTETAYRRTVAALSGSLTAYDNTPWAEPHALSDSILAYAHTLEIHERIFRSLAQENDIQPEVESSLARLHSEFHKTRHPQCPGAGSWRAWLLEEAAHAKRRAQLLRESIEAG